MSERKPEHLSVYRAKAATKSKLQQLFEFLAEELSNPQIPVEDRQSRLWNCDKAGIFTDLTSKRVLSERGARDVYHTSGGSGKQIHIVHACGSAASHLPPYILYPGKINTILVKANFSETSGKLPPFILGKNIWDRWCLNGPKGVLYGASESGWMERDNFCSWFETLFIQSVRYLIETGPVVLFMDGHAFHLGLKVIQKARKNNIHLIAVQSHTTHITQPLDVGLFGPMKSKWRAINDDLRRKTSAAVVDKAIFPSVVAQLWDCDWSKALIGGFSKTGIFLFSPYAIPNENLSPSEVFSDDKDDDSKQVLNDSSLDTDVENIFKGTVTITPTTPMAKTYPKKHFTKVLQGARDQKTKSKGAVGRKKVGLTHYGETLTSDEVFFRLREQAEKNQKQERPSQHQN